MQRYKSILSVFFGGDTCGELTIVILWNVLQPSGKSYKRGLCAGGRFPHGLS